MIDTVVLTIPAGKFLSVNDPQTPLWKLHSGLGDYRKSIKVPTSSQKLAGAYWPRVSLHQRGGKTDLRIEFSVPKLLLNNNVDEVRESEFSDTIKKLCDRLKDFGLITSPDTLAQATVSVFHPSKNIVLSGGYSAHGVIKELAKINLTRKMDLTKDTFRNDGHSLQIYTNSHSFVIYDKVQDLKKSKGRAIDKDPTPKQASLFDSLANMPKQTEILRLEVRIANKRKMNTILEKIDHPKNPTFAQVFQKNLCRDIVSLYWREMIADENLFLFGLASTPQKTLQSLALTYPAIKPKEAIYLTGLQQLCTDENGIQSLRGIIQKHSTQRTWYRIAKDAKKLNAIQNLKHCHEWVRDIESQIKAFDALKIHDLLCKEL